MNMFRNITTAVGLVLAIGGCTSTNQTIQQMERSEAAAEAARMRSAVEGAISPESIPAPMRDCGIGYSKQVSGEEYSSGASYSIRHRGDVNCDKERIHINRDTGGNWKYKEKSE